MKMKNMMVAALFGVAMGMVSAADVTLEGDLVRLAFDGKGCVASLLEKGGRELVRERAPFVSVTAKGKTALPTTLAQDAAGRLVFGFAEGEIVLSVAPFKGGWTFKTERFTVPEATAYAFGRLAPICTQYNGTLVNGWSDDLSAVCTRGYEEGTEFSTAGRFVYCRARRDEVPFEGLRFGIAAGPRTQIREALKAMTLAAGLPHSKTGGAWSLGAADNRRSYLMCYGLHEFTVDDWLELCLRGGFGTFHVDECWVGYGHYDLRPNCFPGGKPALKAAVDKAHAKGLTCDVHTLTSSVGFYDSWVTPEATEGFVVTAEYTLAEPLAATNTTTLVVNEKPSPKHDFVQTYLGNGNYLKIGTEMVQYTGISSNAPWTFTGVKRGAFRTTIKPHAKGDRVIYPRQRFFSFLADADHPLADKVAANIGDLFGVCGFDQIYLDGLDGVEGMRQKDRIARKIYQAAYDRGKPPLYEDSNWIASLWWFHSRIGANDYVFWGPKRSLDRRFGKYIEKARLANFMELDMGWWNILLDNTRSAGYKLDDHEYLGAKCAAHDTAMSVQPGGYPATVPPPPYSFARYLTVLGWYERFRFAQAFNDRTLDRFRVPGDEYRLRQDADGVWRARAAACLPHRVISADLANWTVDSPAAREAAVRVEILENTTAYDAKNAQVLLDPAASAGFTKRAAKGVTVDFSAGSDPAKGATLKVTAANANATPRGAWSQVARTWTRPDYGDVGNRRGFGCWVKGDGSGALLNLQLHAPREYSSGISDHYVTLDFKGWRYVEFHLRERDSEAACEHVWPYRNPNSLIDYPLERVGVKMLAEVSVYLNEIPAGGKTTVEVTAIKMLDTAPAAELKDLAVTLNGADLKLPFPLRTKEYAELDEGFWTRYTSYGVPIERAPAKAPILNYGRNAVRFRATPDRTMTPRAQVTFFALGGKFPALKEDVTAATCPTLAYEAVEPAVYAPTKGFAAIPNLVMRPGEKATVSFEIYGPTAPFKLPIGDETREFPFTLTSCQYVACTDGVHWQLKERSKNFGVKQTGEIAPFKAVAGSVPVSFSCAEPEKANARIDLVKHYCR